MKVKSGYAQMVMRTIVYCCFAMTLMSPDLLRAEESEKGDLSGSLRFRSEYFKNFGLYEKRRSGGDDSEFEHHLRGDLIYQRKVGAENRLLFQGRTAHNFGDNNSNQNFRTQDDVFLHQAWMRFNNLHEDWDLKIGRQELSFSNEILIGRDDWSSEGRSFDAIRLSRDGFEWDIDLFYALTQEGLSGEEDSSLSGIHGKHMNPMRTIKEIYFYHLGVPTSHAPFDSLDQVEANIYNLGFSIEGKISPPLFGQAMVNFQRGELKSVGATERDHKAYHLYGNLDWFLNGDIFRNIGMEFSLATGDKASTTDNETFMPLFSSSHSRSGAMDWFSHMNSVVYTLYLMYDISEFWEGHLEVHHFELESSGAAWYLSDLNTAWWNGTPRIDWPNDGASPKDAGSEIDLHWTWTSSPERVFHFGYSIFFPGALLRDSKWWNEDQKVHWAYFQTELSF